MQPYFASRTTQGHRCAGVWWERRAATKHLRNSGNDSGNDSGGSPSPMALLVGGPIVVPRDSRAASRVAHLNPGRGETQLCHILLDAVAPADYGGGSGGGASSTAVSLSRTRRHVPRGGVQAEMWTSLSPPSSASSSVERTVERTVERKEQGGAKGSAAAAGPWEGDVYVEMAIVCRVFQSVARDSYVLSEK